MTVRFGKLRFGTVLAVAAATACTGGGDAEPPAEPGEPPAATADAGAPPPGCTVLTDISDLVEGFRATHRERLEEEGGYGEPSDSSALEPWEDLRDLYADLAAELGGEPADAVVEHRVEPIDRLLESVDDDRLTATDDPDVAAERRVLAEAPTWRLLPDAVTLTCDDVDGSASFAAGTTAEATTPHEVRSALTAYPPRAHVADRDPDLWMLPFLEEPGTLQPAFLIDAPAGTDLSASGLWRSSYAIVAGRWTAEVTYDAGDGDRLPANVEIEVATDPTWVDRRLPDGAQLDGDGRAEFTTDVPLSGGEPLEPGRDRRVALRWDPGGSFGIAVAVADGPGQVPVRDVFETVLDLLDVEL